MVKNIIKDGLYSNNAIFKQMLGLCPTLAVTTSAVNALGMGLATTAVLTGSNLVNNCNKACNNYNICWNSYIFRNISCN